jgi:glutaminyl-peptide cyclotransferase
VRRTILLCLCLVIAAGCGGSSSESAARPANRFDGGAAYRWVNRQLAFGPRPAGSRQLYRLAAEFRRALPNGRYEAVPHGLKNVVGTVPGRGSGFVVVGAHYDTKDIPGFVGAVDGASPSAVVVQLARTLKPRAIGPTVRFVLFDGEESPDNTPDSEFLETGIRGSKVAAKAYSDAKAMILLDFVGQRGLSMKREQFSDRTLWAKLHAAAARAGYGKVFQAGTEAFGIYDDHYPFTQEGVPSIDLIGWPYACYHKLCDNLAQVSERSLDATGESVLELLRTL